MPPRLAPIHRAFSTEMQIIGRLLVDYSELEIDLMNCVSTVRKDLDSTLKVMFRTRGETARINSADALARQLYTKLSLDSEFSEAIDAMRHCLKIRNKFAHAYWHDPQVKQLCYISLEDLADTNEMVTDLLSLDFFFLDIPLLERHEEFFRYTEDVLTYVNFEGRCRTGIMTSPNPFSQPTRLERPPLYTRRLDNRAP